MITVVDKRNSQRNLVPLTTGDTFVHTPTAGDGAFFGPYLVMGTKVINLVSGADCNLTAFSSCRRELVRVKVTLTIENE